MMQIQHLQDETSFEAFAQASVYCKHMNFDERLKRVRVLVEASSEEQYLLWCLHSYESRHRSSYGFDAEWKEDTSGFGFAVGFHEINNNGIVDKMPIMAKVSFAMINGCTVLFYSTTSQLVDWSMVDGWVQEMYGAEIKNNKILKIDSTNFLQCFDFINRINAEGAQ